MIPHADSEINVRVLHLMKKRARGSVDRPVKRLTQLRSLNLEGKAITDSGIAHLKGLTQLQSLNCWMCSAITDAGIEHLTPYRSCSHLISATAQRSQTPALHT